MSTFDLADLLDDLEAASYAGVERSQERAAVELYIAAVILAEREACAAIVEAKANADAPIDGRGKCEGCGTDSAWRERVGRHEYGCSRARLLDLATAIRSRP